MKVVCIGIYQVVAVANGHIVQVLYKLGILIVNEQPEAAMVVVEYVFNQPCVDAEHA